MMIGKLNRFFTRHGKLAFVVILLAVGIPFILMDVWQGGQGGFGDDVVLARVNNEAVSKEEFYRQLYAVELQGILYRPESGILSLDRSETLRLIAPEVFRRVHMLQIAREKNLDNVSDREIALRIKQYPQFLNQETGDFALAQYENFKNGYMRHRSMTQSTFYSIIRDEIIFERLMNPIIEGSTINHLELHANDIESNATATIKVARLGYWDVDSELPTGEAVRAFYEEHKESRFGIGEQKQLLVLYSNALDFVDRPEVSDEEVRAYFDENVDEFRGKEVEVDHILIGSTATDAPEVRERKRAEAQALLDQVKQGADFAALARQHSTDTSSAAKGGSLGFVRPERRPELAPKLLDHEKGVVYPELLPSRFGFHIAKRGEIRDIVTPFDEARNTISYRLEMQKDDAMYVDAARELYEERKETAYKPIPEVRVSHILIRSPRDEPEEERQAARANAEELLAQIREGADFAELAKEHSADGSAAQGGDLGWYNPDAYVPEFAEVAKNLEVDAVSDVIETQFGYHIVKKLEANRVKETSFEDVKNSLMSQVRRTQMDAARQKAREMVKRFQEKLTTHDNAAIYSARAQDQVALFRSLAEAFVAEHEGEVHLESSGYFDAASSFVPGMPDSSGKLKEAAARLNASRPVSVQVVDAGNHFMIAALQDVKAARVPDFADVEAQVRTALSEERKIEVARQNMRQYRDRLAAAMEEGLSLEEATDRVNADFAFNLEFVAIPPFTLDEEPDTNEARMSDEAPIIAQVTRETPAGTLSGATDSKHGAVIVYVEKVDVETTEMEPRMRMFMEYQYRQMLMGAAMRAFQERMAQEADYRVLVGWLVDDSDNGQDFVQ